jgi:hypothetical protein
VARTRSGLRTSSFGALLSLVGLVGCTASVREGTTVHLLPGLGGAVELGVPAPNGGWAPGDLGSPEDVTRPAALFRDGEIRRCAVDLPRPSELVFDLALSAPSPADWTLDVRLGSAPLAKETLSAKRWNMWTPFAIPVPPGRRSDLTFEAHGAGGATRLLLGAPRLERRQSERPPRVLLWISQDALGADHLSPYGYTRDTSPFFTKLAKASVLFEDAVAPATWTLPSLASQFTSRYPPFHGAVGEDSARDESTPTLFEILSKNGFTVLGVTGNRYIGPYFHMVSGFDAVFYTPGHGDSVVRLAEAAIDEWRGGDLVLFVHFMDTHFPYEPPPPYDTAFDPDYKGLINGRNFFDARKSLTPRDVEHVRALYDGAALYADSEIEKLLMELEGRGVPKESVLVYSADHGEGFLEHGRFLHAGTVYRELTRVPLALRLPGIEPGRRQEVVSLLDLAPTLLETLGIPRPGSFQGRSLVPLLTGRAWAEEPALSETQVTNNNVFWKVAITNSRESLLVKLPRGGDPSDGLSSEERFDRRSDPFQKNPLPAPDSPLKEKVIAYLKGAHAHAARSTRAEVPPEVRERLRALGYLKE